MSNIDSKFAKSLQNHGLQNLVFQKRQRKTLTQQPLAIVHSSTKTQKTKKNHQTQQSKQKTLPIKNMSKQKSLSPKVQQKNKIIKKRKYLTSQKALKNRTIKSRVTLKKQTNTPKQEKINTRFKQKQIQKPKKQSQRQKQSSNISNKLRKKSKIQNDSIKIQSQQKIDSQPKIQQTQNKQVQKSQKKLGRPRKPIIPKESLTPNDEHNAQNQLKANNFKSPIKSRALSNILEIGSKYSLKQIQQTPKPRQAKLNALKKYTEKQFQEEDSFQYDRQISSKRKRIFKINRPENYSINRIFRKQPKLDLNPINIKVKLDKLSLNAFKEKFGTFDVIHCSLPLSMIWQISEIQSLMVKGFLFIWVEKGQTAIAYHLMKRLGYDVIDQIVWVKCQEASRTVFNDPLTHEESYLSQDDLFLNSKSVCFVGYKCPTGQKAEYRTKISNNIIFSRPCFRQPLKRPQQIYEIADLLMPGSRKLQLGGKKQNGWLSLEHKETRLRKCVVCCCQLSLGRDGRVFINSQTKGLSSICQSCYLINDKQRQQNVQDNESEDESQELFEVPDQTIKIKKVQYVKHQTPNICIRCQNISCEETIVCSCNSQSQELFCSQCYMKQFETHLQHSIDKIIVKKKIFLSQIYLSCSNCPKKTLHSHYYQCVASGYKTKAHILCQQCFWKAGYNLIQNENEIIQSNRKKNDGLHEWRIRNTVSLPSQKATCSCSCKSELQLPYFVCETCVGWRWCGKCRILNDETHTSDQTSRLTNEENSLQHKMCLMS